MRLYRYKTHLYHMIQFERGCTNCDLDCYGGCSKVQCGVEAKINSLPYLSSCFVIHHQMVKKGDTILNLNHHYGNTNKI